MRISKPGIYDISAEEYHSDPCETPSLSASIVKVLADETPLHAWTKHPRLNPNFERKEDDKFVMGNASHSLILGDPKRFAILPFDTYQSKDAKTAKQKALDEGRIPIKEKDWPRVNDMVAAAREQLAWARDFQTVFKNGKPEQTLIWSEGEGADLLWFRVRLDWLPDDRTAPYDDFKSTECADPESWSRILFNVRHDIQAAFYRRGIRALGLNRQPIMRFVVQETTEPYCLSVVKMSGEGMELADRDIDRAIRKWQWCRKMGRWPGYPAHVHTAEVPGWMQEQKMAREIRIGDAAKEKGSDPDMLAASFARQSPAIADKVF